MKRKSDIDELKAAEEKLQQNEQVLKSIYNTTALVLYYLAVEPNDQYRFLSVNNAFEKVTGIPASEIIGKLVNQIIPEPSLSLVLDNYKKSIQEKQIVQWEETSEYPTGKLTGEASIAPVFDIKGNCTNLVGAVQDITERKKNEINLIKASRLYSFISEINSMIVRTNDKERIFSEVCRISVELGKYLFAWIGYADEDENIIPVTWDGKGDGYLENIKISKKDIISGRGPTGTSIRESRIYYCNDIATDPAMGLWREHALKRGFKSSVALPIYCGNKVVNALTLYAGEPNFFNSEELKLLENVVSNVSFALNSIENERIKKHAEASLIKALEKAEEMNRLKTSFLSNMSHELRTPMIGILGYSEMLVDESKDTFCKDAAKIINESGNRLMRTLNMILNLSHIESGKVNVEYKSVDLIKVARECCKLFQSFADKKGVSLKVVTECESLKINIDEMMLHEILQNLVNNALKFTNKGEVTVEITSCNLNIKDWAEIKVRDTGIGISKQNQTTIWDEFRQVSEGLGRSFEGTGLGLTLTRKFVELMNGTITLESELNVGSVFTLRFPIIKAPAADTPPSPVIEMPAMHQTEELSTAENLPVVLYVEDDPNAIKIVSKILRPICNLDIATNSIEAMQKVEAKQYSAILMDINLGRGADGLVTTKSIRQIESYIHTPIIALTAFAMEEDKEQCLLAGCSDYLSKPFEKKDLINIVLSVLKRN